MTTAKHDYAALTSAVRHVLLTMWDPIGIQELPPATREANSDEYDAYLAPLIQRMTNVGSESDLGDYLRDVEMRRMGLKPRFSRASTAAKALMELKSKFLATTAG